MKYMVTFRKHCNAEGESDSQPASLVDAPEGVILDAEFVETVEPAGLGVAEDLNDGTGSQDGNDSGFLAVGSETWVYDVADGRGREFKNAVLEGQAVIAIEEVPDESLTT